MSLVECVCGMCVGCTCGVCVCAFGKGYMCACGVCACTCVHTMLWSPWREGMNALVGEEGDALPRTP